MKTKEEKQASISKMQSNLVDAILNTFETPSEWPLMPQEMADFARSIYQRCCVIRDVENDKL